jgi:hypothetical protein
VADSPIFAKVKSWLERRKQTELAERCSQFHASVLSYAAAGGCVLIGSFAGNKPPTGTSQWGQGPFFTEAMLRWLSRAQEPVAYR